MSSTRVTQPTGTSSSPPVAASPALSPPINPLLAAYLAQLSANPLRTKQCTLGTFQFLQDILANHIAGVPPKKLSKDAPAYERLLAAAKIDSRAFKMALYGFFVSAPLGHALVGRLQKAFAGQTGTKAKVLQILASNLITAPVQIFVYLVCTSIINGARTSGQVATVVNRGFMQAMKLTWITSPIAIAIAQNYLSPELWVPFFNLITFITGTIFSAKVKKAQLEAARRETDKGKPRDD